MSSHPPRCQTSSACRLNSSQRLQIAWTMSPLSLFRAACRKLHYLPTETQITKAFLNLEARREDSPVSLNGERASPSECDLRDYQWIQSLPCYDCMRLLPKTKFPMTYSKPTFFQIDQRRQVEADPKNRYCFDCAVRGRWFQQIDQLIQIDSDGFNAYHICCQGCNTTRTVGMYPWSPWKWWTVCRACWADCSLSTRLLNLKARAMYSRYQEDLKREKKMYMCERTFRDLDYSAVWDPKRCEWTRKQKRS
jgi:hypothetical protein